MVTEITAQILTILTVNIQTISRIVDLAAEGLAKGAATFTADIDFEAKAKAKAISTVLIVATHKGGTSAEVTHRIKGLAADTAETTHNNGLKNATSITKKAAGLYNTL